MAETEGSAVIIGASGGIGAALARLVEAGGRLAPVHRLSRPEIDLTDEDSIAAAAARAGRPRLVIVATGALEIDGTGPEKRLRDIDPAAMAAQFRLNAIGPALVLKHFAPRLPRRGKSVIACLSARVGSIGDNRLGGWVSYRASKAALNQVVKVASIELARSHPEACCIALHPGTVRTPLTEKFRGDRKVFEPEEAAAKLLAVIDALAPGETGVLRDHGGRDIPW